MQNKFGIDMNKGVFAIFNTIFKICLYIEIYIFVLYAITTIGVDYEDLTYIINNWKLSPIKSINYYNNNDDLFKKGNFNEIKNKDSIEENMGKELRKKKSPNLRFQPIY